MSLVHSINLQGSSGVRHGSLSFSPALYPPMLRWAIAIVGILALAAIAMWFYSLSGDARRFPVNEVEVLGTLDYTDRDELRDLVIAQTENGFYRLNVDEIRLDVIKLPWVAQAHVRRVWPDRLSIEVVEHEPTARWNDDSLISKRFELFKPPQLGSDNLQRDEWLSYFSQFPRLSGTHGRHESVLNSYRAMQLYMQEFEVGIQALTEDGRRSQTLVLASDVTVKLGNTDIEERMRRFVDVYSRMVAPLKGRAAHFDMRYSNGFAMLETNSN